MGTRGFIVKVGILGGTYLNPHCSCVIRPEILIADHDAKYGFKSDAIVATLTTNIEA